VDQKINSDFIISPPRDDIQSRDFIFLPNFQRFFSKKNSAERFSENGGKLIGGWSSFERFEKTRGFEGWNGIKQ
jgi:hypothetical protein